MKSVRELNRLRRNDEKKERRTLKRLERRKRNNPRRVRVREEMNEQLAAMPEAKKKNRSEVSQHIHPEGYKGHSWQKTRWNQK